MSPIVTDTHSLLWFLSRSPRLSRVAHDAMQSALSEGHPLLVPSICLVEIIYLTEKQRIPAEGLERLHGHLDEPDSGLLLVPLDLGVTQALQTISRLDVPDMPDRIIAATALRLGLPLVSADRKIRASIVETIW